MAMLFVGAELTTEGVDDIREESLMTRSLCVRLAGFGDGLERDINITLEFVSSQMDFDNAGMEIMSKNWARIRDFFSGGHLGL